MTTPGSEAPLLALLPSPLLGPAAWVPTAAALTRAGRDVVVPDVPSSPNRLSDVWHAFLAPLPRDRQIVLVPHSNAGLHVGVLVGLRSVCGALFVDAGLPGWRRRVRMVSRARLRILARLADANGVLPPWTQWWSPDEVAALFPSAESRARVEAQQPRVPLAYLRRSAPVLSDWDEMPCGYLAFGDTYAEERARAAERGWPVATLPGGHLHMMVAPDAVAAEIDQLIRRLLDGSTAVPRPGEGA